MNSGLDAGVSQLATLLRENGMCLPDYQGQGLFNLAVSLGRLSGSPVSPAYRELQLPDGRTAGESWGRFEKLIFLLVDGLGDAFLAAHRDLAPNLWRDRVAQLSSVFPSTTATAITTVQTAEPPAVHGLLGWFVQDVASGLVVAPLPMRLRGSQVAPSPALIARLLRVPPVWREATRQVHIVTLPALSEGPFSTHHLGAAHIHHYGQLAALPEAVAAALQGQHGSQYVYAYTPELDRVAHLSGIDSDAARQTLAQVDAAYVQLRRSVPDALVVVSADHGFIDNPPGRQIDLDRHPDLAAMLRAPLSGESRAAYCHVKPSCVAEFGVRMRGRFGDALVVLPSEEACQAGLFGPGGMSPEIRQRCGDWILLAREGWVVRDCLPGEAEVSMLGVHGGMSAAEMQIPLIVGGM
jgi:predicted AlkP superfamily pyrophosphatase or phosphodiesterase